MKTNGISVSHARSIKYSYPSAGFRSLNSLSSVAVLLMSLTVMSPSNAGEWYVGGAVGTSTADPDIEDIGLKNTQKHDTGFKLFVGQELSEQLSVEAFAADLGTAKIIDGTDMDYQSYGAGIALSLPSNKAPVYGYAKGGMAYTDISSDRPLGKDSKLYPFGGVGAEFKTGSGFALRGEYEVFNSDNKLISLGVIKRFGSDSEEVMVMHRDTPVPARSKTVKAPERKPLVRPIQKPVPQPPVLQEAPKVALNSTDIDRDGVADSVDLCPDTPVGVQVSRIGCASFIGVVNGVSFEPNSDYLNASTKMTLDKIARNIMKYRDKQFVIVGHSDSSEGLDSKKLSLKRALTASRHLVSKGLPAQQLRFAGVGASKPLASNSSEQGKAKNRRIEIYLAGS